MKVGMNGCFGVLASVILAFMAEGNEHSRVHRPAFSVVGLETRTTNAQETTPQGAIPKLWGRLFGEGLLRKISDCADSNVVALYTDYASDKDGAYTYILGCHVKGNPAPPPGMVTRQIPEGEYALWTNRNHPARDAVIRLWQQVWSLEDTHKLHRAYRSDYEVHHMSEGTETAVELFIGVKD